MALGRFRFWVMAIRKCQEGCKDRKNNELGFESPCSLGVNLKVTDPAWLVCLPPPPRTDPQSKLQPATAVGGTNR